MLSIIALPRRMAFRRVMEVTPEECHDWTKREPQGLHLTVMEVDFHRLTSVLLFDHYQFANVLQAQPDDARGISGEHIDGHFLR